MMPTCNFCETQFETSKHLRWHKDDFDIVECPCCSLIFRADLPSPEELGTIYGESYFREAAGYEGGQGYLDYVADQEFHREAARTRLHLLGPFCSVGRLLDVGAAAGFFVDEASRVGWTAQGIDVADSMVDWGRRHLGADLIAGDIANVSLEPRSLDAVTMWDYIEHSCDPMRDLRAAYGALRPGGVLALSTGDVEALVARGSGSRWHLLTPRHHNYFFSARSVCAMLERLGFDIVHVGHPGAAYSVAYLAHKARTLSNTRMTRAVASVLARSAVGRLAVPVNLRDIVTVVAVRREANRDPELAERSLSRQLS